MRKLCFFIFFLFTTLYTGVVHGAQPDWIAPELRKYPIEKYLFHVGRGEGTGKKALEAAGHAAHKRVAAGILENVERVIRFNKNELQHDIVQEHYSAVLEDYCSRQKQPAMNLKGFHIRNLTVDLARTDSDTYALIYIEREKLKQHYAEHVLELSKEINRRLQSAKSAEAAYEIDSAVKKYLQTYPLYEALKEAEVIQIGADYRINSTEAFKRLAKAATDTSGVLEMSHREVIKRVAALKAPMIVFPGDIAKATKFQLSQQSGSMNRECWIEPLIYEDSEMICRFEQEFSDELLKHLGWPIVAAPIHFKPTSPDLTGINRTQMPDRITASCWENGDEITIRTTVRDPNTGDFVATAVVQFLASKLRESIVFQPGNYEQMRSEKDAFDPQNSPLLFKDEDDETTWTPAELEVEVWTHEGRGPVRYVQDEKVKIFVQVNQPAYVRLLYTLADRKRTLLKDNFYIDAAQVNSAVEIGEFLCAAPFGTELLVVAARTEKFPPIETHEEDGYSYIKDEDPESAARRFRGLKPIPDPDTDSQPPDPDPQPSFQQSEAQIVVTTVEK